MYRSLILRNVFRFCLFRCILSSTLSSERSIPVKTYLYYQNSNKSVEIILLLGADANYEQRCPLDQIYGEWRAYTYTTRGSMIHARTLMLLDILSTACGDDWYRAGLCSRLGGACPRLWSVKMIRWPNQSIVTRILYQDKLQFSRSYPQVGFTFTHKHTSSEFLLEAFSAGMCLYDSIFFASFTFL